MNTELTETAVEFGALVRRALEAAGGDTLAHAIGHSAEERAALVVPVLAQLGVWDLDPGSGPDELEAAAVTCRSAGYWAVPYAVANRLARPEGADPTSPRASVQGDFALALGVVLPCWTLLGMFDRALEVTRAYVVDRKQFGQSLSSFQSVQFQLTDAELERIGVEELAKYALWSLHARPADSVADALALRMATLEAAEIVFRVAHQLHGAIGFCDESAVSWLSRASQSLRREPHGLSATREALTRATGRRGLSGLFDDTRL